MLAVCFVAAGAAFAPASAPAPALAARRPAAVPVRLDLGPYLEDERKESIKAGAISAFFGTLAEVPVKASALLAAKTMNVDQFEFSCFALAIELVLFGITYRCIVRRDDNDPLRQGAVGGFALCRALSLTQVKKMWSPDMWLQIGTYFGESALAFGVAAACLESAWNKGYARRLDNMGIPPDFRGWRGGGFDDRFDGGFRGMVRPTMDDMNSYRDGQPRFLSGAGRFGPRDADARRSRRDYYGGPY